MSVLAHFVPVASCDAQPMNRCGGPPRFRCWRAALRWAFAFALLCFGASASAIAPDAPSVTGADLNQHGLSGSWFNPATSGQGFELELFPDLVAAGTGYVFMSWFTFDGGPAGGSERQRWYTLQGAATSGADRAELSIYRNTGGVFRSPR